MPNLLEQAISADDGDRAARLTQAALGVAGHKIANGDSDLINVRLGSLFRDSDRTSPGVRKVPTAARAITLK
jgi:hypothetical protein